MVSCVIIIYAFVQACSIEKQYRTCYFRKTPTQQQKRDNNRTSAHKNAKVIYTCALRMVCGVMCFCVCVCMSASACICHDTLITNHHLNGVNGHLTCARSQRGLAAIPLLSGVFSLPLLSGALFFLCCYFLLVTYGSFPQSRGAWPYRAAAPATVRLPHALYEPPVQRAKSENSERKHHFYSVK